LYSLARIPKHPCNPVSPLRLLNVQNNNNQPYNLGKISQGQHHHMENNSPVGISTCNCI